jgi:hypothetical protein
VKPAHVAGVRALGEDAFLILGAVAGEGVGGADRAGDADRSGFAASLPVRALTLIRVRRGLDRAWRDAGVRPYSFAPPQVPPTQPNLVSAHCSLKVHGRPFSRPTQVPVLH